MHRDWVDDKECAGAMHGPEGIGIHAAKLAFGYLRKARALGAKVHPASPVIGWRKQGDVHPAENARRYRACQGRGRGHRRLYLAPSCCTPS